MKAARLDVSYCIEWWVLGSWVVGGIVTELRAGAATQQHSAMMHQNLLALALWSLTISLSLLGWFYLFYPAFKLSRE